MKKSNRLVRRPAQGRMHRRLEQADCRQEGEYRNREVYAKPRDERARGFAQREKTLGDEEQRANRNNDNRRRKIFHLRILLYQRSPAGGAGTSSATEAVVVRGDEAAFEPFGIEVPKEERRPFFPLHTELLVEVAVIDFSLPTDAQGILAHQAGDRGGVECVDQ